MAITAFPACAISRINLTIVYAVNESSPDVSSIHYTFSLLFLPSRIMIEGFVTISTPIEVRFLSPPEIPLCNTLPTYTQLGPVLYQRIHALLQLQQRYRIHHVSVLILLTTGQSQISRE